MAADKKSFLIYCDSMPMIEKLSDERAGKLFKHIFRYCNDLNPVCDDEVVDMAFEHFKAILKRDLQKYKSICDRNKQNGSLGGRPKKTETQPNPQNPVGYLETQPNPTKPKKADTDTDNDTDRETDKELKLFCSFSFDDFWSMYPKKVSKVKCEGLFNKLSDRDKEKIKNTLPFFIAYKPFKEYNHPNPQTYLNSRRWDDEINPTSGSEQKFKCEYRNHIGKVIHIHTQTEIDAFTANGFQKLITQEKI